MSKCYILFIGDEVGLEDTSGCLKEEGHNGAHVFRNTDGKLIEWEDDYTCECGCWDDYENDPHVCKVYSEVEDIS